MKCEGEFVLLMLSEKLLLKLHTHTQTQKSISLSPSVKFNCRYFAVSWSVFFVNQCTFEPNEVAHGRKVDTKI